MKMHSLHSLALQYFQEVAQQGNLTAAARSLHVAPSAISRQISKLEDGLGLPLFYRQSQGMALTPAGRQVLLHAKRNALDLEELASRLQGLQGLEQSVIRLACTDGFAQNYLPAVMAAFQQEKPGIRFTLEVCAPAAASRLVSDGDVDVALTFTLAPQEGIRVEYSEKAPIYAHVANTHPLAKMGQAYMQQITQYPVVLPSNPNIVRQLFDLCCGIQDLHPTILLSSNSLAALTGYLHHTDAVNFCGSLSVRNVLKKHRQTLVRVLDTEMAQRVLQVQTMTGRELSLATRHFVQYLIADMRKRRRGLARTPRAAAKP